MLLEPWWAEVARTVDDAMLTRCQAVAWTLRNHRSLVTSTDCTASSRAIVLAALDAWDLLATTADADDVQNRGIAAGLSLSGDRTRLRSTVALAHALSTQAEENGLHAPGEALSRAQSAWQGGRQPASMRWAPTSMLADQVQAGHAVLHPASAHVMVFDILQTARAIAAQASHGPVLVALARGGSRTGWLMDAIERCGCAVGGAWTTPWLSTAHGSAALALADWRHDSTWGAACRALDALAAIAVEPGDLPPVPLDQLACTWASASVETAIGHLLSKQEQAQDRLRWSWRHAAFPGPVASWIDRHLRALNPDGRSWVEHARDLGILVPDELACAADLEGEDRTAFLAAISVPRERGGEAAACVFAPPVDGWMQGRTPILIPHLLGAAPDGFLSQTERQALGVAGPPLGQLLNQVAQAPDWVLAIPSAAQGIPGEVATLINDHHVGVEHPILPVRGLSAQDDLGPYEGAMRAVVQMTPADTWTLPAAVSLTMTPETLGVTWQDGWCSILDQADVGSILQSTGARDEGTDLHRMLQQLLPVPPARWAEEARIALAAWCAAGEDPWDRLLRKHRMPDMLDAIISEARLLADGRTAMPETEISVHLTIPGRGPVRLRGRVDRCDRLRMGSYWITDYKRGRGDHQRRSLLDGRDAQLLLYLEGHRQCGHQVAGGHYRALGSGMACGYYDPILVGANVPERASLVDVGDIPTRVAALEQHLGKLWAGTCPIDLSDDAPSRRYAPITRSDDLSTLLTPDPLS